MSHIHDLIIIGAGPAGLTAGIYAGRSRLDAVIFEKMSIGGRILMSEIIENYPGFPGGVSTHELMQKMEQQVRDLGIGILNEEVLEMNLAEKKIKTHSGNYQAKAIIIATGARPRKLNISGEDEFVGRGVSYCATCDGPFFRGKKVIVVGGGNAVAEEAIYLTRFAESVNVVHRRQDLRASAILQEKMKQNKKINFILNSVITEIKGSAKVEAVTIKDLIKNTGSEFKCDGIFIYIGYDPDTSFLNGQHIVDKTGFVLTDEHMATAIEGVFACGDCRKKSLYQVINACGDGAIAAEGAYKFIANKG